MKPRKNASIDGFVTRRSDRGSLDNFTRRTTLQSEEEATNSIGVEPKSSQLSDLEQSLQNIDKHTSEPAIAIKKRRGLFRRRRDRAKHRTTFQKWRRRVLLTALLLILAGVGYFGYRTISVVAKVTHGNLLSLIQPGEPLKTDDQGRTNILVFGTSQDDSAHQDASGGGGLWLTDSIMLISMNQNDHTVKMVSIPRDLWVAMPNSCSVGYQAKINAVYECGGDLQNFDSSEQQAADYSNRDQKGAQALEASIQKVTGVTPQYYVHVNYKVLQQAVDAVGGVQVGIVGDGADGIYDTNFDWNCPNGGRPYTCKNVYYPHDGTYTLDGLHALYLARARGDFGSYSYKDFGLARGDFDRQLNQQKILAALQKKILSSGTLLNPIAVTSLLDALGSNITTDIQGGNYKTLIDFMKKMPKTNAMQNISLGGAAGGQEVVQGGMIDGQSVEVPVAGAGDYSEIISYIAKQLSSNPAASENASIAIFNASGTAGAAGKLQTKLAAAGLNVVSTGNASASDAGTTQYTIYDTTSGKMPQTINYLQTNLSGAQVSTQATPTDLVGAGDIIIVINK